MRTTLSIRDDLYEAARQRAFDERRTLGDVVNELIASGLEARSAGAARQLGAFAGQITIAEGFDNPISEVQESLDQPINP